jgi:UDPglucose 6-dehydrogenase
MSIAGIMGLGTVGGTLRDAFEGAGIATRTYDPYLGVGAVEGLAPSDVVFVCVPTPADGDGGFDLSEVWAAVHDVAPVLRPGAVIAMKSTVTPGTSDRLAAAFPSLRFCSVPEFLVAARPHESLARPDRVIIGASSDEAASLVASFMSAISPTAPIVRMRPVEAELAKLCSNVMLASKVAIANELAMICEGFGVAWPAVQSAVGLDRRIGPDHLGVTAERGFGGGCFPKDLDGLIAAAREAGHTPTVLQEIAAFNRRIRAEAAGRPMPDVQGNGSGPSSKEADAPPVAVRGIDG